MWRTRWVRARRGAGQGCRCNAWGQHLAPRPRRQLRRERVRDRVSGGGVLGPSAVGQVGVCGLVLDIAIASKPLLERLATSNPPRAIGIALAIADAGQLASGFYINYKLRHTGIV